MIMNNNRHDNCTGTFILSMYEQKNTSNKAIGLVAHGWS